MPLISALLGALLTIIPGGVAASAINGAGPVVGAAPPPVPAPSCTPARGYRPPVAAAVSDPFRAPTHPFGPGNRGVEYATRPGSPIGAIGPGVVLFAGQVGGQLYVTVRHGDGLRSSYAFLAEVLVDVGQTVRRGEVVGRAGPVTHLGVRCGDAYLDPATVFETRTRVRLVPDRWFPGKVPGSEPAGVVPEGKG